jgi:ATP-binding cassette subfamily B protein
MINNTTIESENKTHFIPRDLKGFIWHFVKSHKFFIIGLSLLSPCWAIEVTMRQYILKMIIDRITDMPVTASIISILALPTILYIVLETSTSILYRVFDYIILRVMPLVLSDIWRQIFNYVQYHSVKFFQDNFAGNIANKVNDISQGVEDIVHFTLWMFLPNLFLVLFSFCLLFSVHHIFAFIMLIWIIIYFIVNYKLSFHAVIQSKKFSESKSRLVGCLVDMLTNISSIRLFSRYNYETKILGKYLENTVQKDREMQWQLLKIKAILSFLGLSLLLTMLVTLIYAKSKDYVTAGDFALVLTLSSSIIENMSILLQSIVSLTKDIGKSKQALETILVPHETADVKNAKTLKVKNGEIEFINVTFQYNRNNNVFENTSITIKPGSKTGLVGISGSGKTTFVNLILRYFDINDGVILIDGQNIANVTQSSLRSQISVVPQDPSLFHRTVLDNISYGKDNATKREIINASMLAHCHDFIKKLPHGYMTIVGDRGAKLSGGQRQRIAIARAFLENAKILILDEATSALDSITEKKIQKALDKLMKDKTTLIIAHRLSTLVNMERILVFRRGHIIEDGSHIELLAKNGYYARLWKMQTNGLLPDQELSEEYD